MIHKFKFDDTRMVVDVHSGAVHVVDELVWDILDSYQAKTPAEIVQGLSGKYPPEQVEQALTEINQLVEEGLLFTSDPHQAGYQPRREGVIKALCLHAAHDCNLRCKYCFAGQGQFGGPSGLLSLEVGKAAIDFLIEQSGNRKNIEIDFFGGEPLLNFKVIKELVPYGHARAEQAGKKFKFTLTTNGVLLNKEIQQFLLDNNMAAVLSLDGRPAVHDAMRPTPRGNGSYEQVVKAFQEYVEQQPPAGYYIRGTFTRHNLDFSQDVMHMAELGFKDISVEPVVAGKDTDYAFQQEDLPILMEEYEKLTRELWQRQEAGEPINFFHFNIDLNGGPCLPKRLSGCGAGYEYLAVTPEGDLYPCHQFVGNADFCLGTVKDGIHNQELIEKFRQAHIYNKPECVGCWAKFYCSGGCHANAWAFNKDLLRPYTLGCQLARKRFECAIYLQVKQAGLA
ncbi:thioether cross-link-forming SCIFF peptide maturase [Desulforamulus ferrireducens]|uniref:Thioether cross-link-forming SCIFF peptide maturase n=1 Tax=Desulforamulus ferrireducens TaxID=1833852 RepID=A0A1S6ISH8_9FIRM|nr:thioether cross-link-forming SCIFF peptide maturase [Desulforamulus ferrireducens]AQS57731.1 thioether cross-link-forming SCIFF peptide maturase [Desulforamulus ferrireducens]